MRHSLAMFRDLILLQRGPLRPLLLTPSPITLLMFKTIHVFVLFSAHDAQDLVFTTDILHAPTLLNLYGINSTAMEPIQDLNTPAIESDFVGSD